MVIIGLWACLGYKSAGNGADRLAARLYREDGTKALSGFLLKSGRANGNVPPGSGAEKGQVVFSPKSYRVTSLTARSRS